MQSQSIDQHTIAGNNGNCYTAMIVTNENVMIVLLNWYTVRRMWKMPSTCIIALDLLVEMDIYNIIDPVM